MNPNPESGCLLAYVTFPTKEMAISIGKDLVGAGLAAGVNIFGPGLSIFRWDGKIQQKEEWYLLAQTKSEQFEELQAFTLKRHPYKNPCVIALPITMGSKPFLRWIAQGGQTCGQ